jgi:hypothetical protein
LCFFVWFIRTLTCSFGLACFQGLGLFLKQNRLANDSPTSLVVAQADPAQLFRIVIGFVCVFVCVCVCLCVCLCVCQQTQIIVDLRVIVGSSCVLAVSHL